MIKLVSTILRKTNPVRRQAIAILIVILGVIIAGRALLVPTQVGIRLELQSNPFPMVIGPAQLQVSVLDTNGVPVDATGVEMGVEMTHEDMLPLYAPVSRQGVGVFTVPVMWSMSGQWTVDITATLPDGQTRVNDSFDVYVYPTYVTVADNLTQFRSTSENQSLVTDPAREQVIIIPQGTRAMLLTGVDHDIIPLEIRLNVSGQNTLIIQNNDVADHVVGPFNIRAGETIRQKFTVPNVFVGVCSVNSAATVSIIVED